MVRIILSGCNGRMGQAIVRLASENPNTVIVAGIDPFDGINNAFPVFSNAADVCVEGDVIIDFSNPASLVALLNFALSKSLPVVISTTGHTEQQLALAKAATDKIAIFISGNMSLGINLLLNLVSKAAMTLEGLFDIEIIEKHHNKKIDAPSGTALMLANAANNALKERCDFTYERESKREKRSEKEIGIHSIRGGNIVGEHSVIFAGNEEIIEIKHTATSREVFAVGALKAAEYMADKKNGFHNMSDVIGI
ncbi:MAG: 4-hydroxy-tetrahydrodipicolinate reductase [Bacillota bacterium]